MNLVQFLKFVYFVHVYVGVHLPHTIFIHLHFEPSLQRFLLYVILFHELLNSSPSGLQYSCGVGILNGGGEQLPIWSQPNQSGTSFNRKPIGTQLESTTSWSLYITPASWGGHAKSGSTSTERKAVRCWRWLKGWLKTGTLSMKACLCLFYYT